MMGGKGGSCCTWTKKSKNMMGGKGGSCCTCTKNQTRRTYTVTHTHIHTQPTHTSNQTGLSYLDWYSLMRCVFRADLKVATVPSFLMCDGSEFQTERDKMREGMITFCLVFSLQSRSFMRWWWSQKSSSVVRYFSTRTQRPFQSGWNTTVMMGSLIRPTVWQISHKGKGQPFCNP